LPYPFGNALDTDTPMIRLRNVSLELETFSMKFPARFLNVFGIPRVSKQLLRVLMGLLYEMWDLMIEKVKIEIYKKEKRSTSQKSLFYDVVHGILVARWAKNNTPLHCLAHSLNPRFYSDAWLLEDSTRSAPHRDVEISQERMKCFRRLFPNDDEHSKVLDEYAMFSMKSGCFSDLTSISMMGTMEPKSWNPNDDVKMWDVGGDAFDSMEDVGFLEFADLSLDEPEFENDLIINN
ncbi:hypothetical protein Tco_0217797, partial [Tanacetum coccineum]